MIQLGRDECRVLGVLVEKAQTTPAQYPMTLNGLQSGANQKSNRLPVMNLNEDRIIEALDRLRAKGLVRELMLTGSRVQKYRHNAREALEIGTSELVVLAELLLRGPQTVGELRGRASRMHPLESLEVVESVLETLGGRAEPMVKKLPPAPGSRAPRYAQLLCPDLHPESPAESTEPGGGESIAGRAGPTPRDAALAHPLEARVERLEQDVAELRRTLEELLG